MSPTFVEYEAAYLEPLVSLWRESFEFGVGITDPHPLSEQREAFLSQVLPSHRVTLALVESKLIGFVAASAESVSQLHVQVGLHRQGIGSALLALAKAESRVACGCIRLLKTPSRVASTRSMASSSSRAGSNLTGSSKMSNTAGQSEVGAAADTNLGPHQRPCPFSNS